LRKAPSQVLLTFDVEGIPPREDYFNNVSLICLQIVLDLLEERNLKGIFFITQNAAESIREHPDVAQRLSRHQIGYHGSSHSISPSILEYTDIPNYEKACAISLKKERDGILALKEAFPKNEIVCFRAPFLAWSPPHLEALRELGISFDFSAEISEEPVSFKGITFYPAPISIDEIAQTFVQKKPDELLPTPVFTILLKRKVSVLLTHPSKMVAEKRPNRKKYKNKGIFKTQLFVSSLELLLDIINLIEKTGLIQTTVALSRSWHHLDSREVNVESVYRSSVRAQMYLFDIKPQFVFSHFLRFFDKKKETRNESDS